MMAKQDRPSALTVLQFLVGALIGVMIFAATGMAVVWVLAGILSGWLTCRLCIRKGKSAEPSKKTRISGQVLVGGVLGPAVASQDFQDVGVALLLILASLIVVIVISLGVSVVYSRLFGVDQTTAGLATLPGGLAIMPSVAADLGKPVTLVALIQASRLSGLVLAVTVVAFLLGDVETLGMKSLIGVPQDGISWFFWVALLLLCPVAYKVAKVLRIPVPALLGPLLVTALAVLVFRASGIDLPFLEVPFIQEAVGQLLLGITVGEYLAQKVRVKRNQVLGGLLSILVTFLASFLVALAITPLAPWDLITSLLVMVPGGAPEMVIIASAVGAEMHVVVIAQTVRQVLVNILMPFWIYFFRRVDPDDST